MESGSSATVKGLHRRQDDREGFSRPPRRHLVPRRSGRPAARHAGQAAAPSRKNVRKVGSVARKSGRRAHHLRHAQATCATWSAGGAFRQDLFYRLNVIGCACRPARDFSEDIRTAGCGLRRRLASSRPSGGGTSMPLEFIIRSPATCASWKTSWSAPCACVLRRQCRSRRSAPGPERRSAGIPLPAGG